MGYYEISPRKTGYKHVNPISTFSIPSKSAVLSHFKQAKGDIYDVRESVNRSSASNQMLKAAQGCVLRSSVVMACSAFDLYVHELLYLSFFSMKNGQIKTPTKDFIEFKNSCSEGELNKNPVFYSKMAEKYGYTTMSNPNNFIDILNCMGINNREQLYVNILNKNGKTVLPEQAEKELKWLMKTYYKRRNLIAHSYDYNLPNGQEEITDEFVTDYVKLLSNIVDVLSEHVNKIWE